MAIVAIPRGVEITKVTKAQERALDKLLKAQRDENTVQTAIRVAIPTVAFVGVAGVAIATTFAYLKDIELPTVSELATNAGGTVSDLLISGIETVTGQNEPSTPEFLPSGAGPIPRCKRWETDYVTAKETEAQKGTLGPLDTVFGALTMKRIIQNMKREGCERPVIIPLAQWNEA
jgi:hypothetical protein